MRACWIRNTKTVHASIHISKGVSSEIQVHIGKDFVLKAKAQYSNLLGLNRETRKNSFNEGHFNGDQ